MNYEDFCHIACVCTEQIGPKCRRFFSPSNFMKFEKDEQGRIAILPFYLYVMRTVGHLPSKFIELFTRTLNLMNLSNVYDSLINTGYGYAGFTYAGKNRYE